MSRISVSVCMVLALAAGAAHADLIPWKNSTSGPFSQSARWTTGTVPGAGDGAKFAVGNAEYTVKMNFGAAPKTIKYFVVEGKDKVTFDMTGATFKAADGTKICDVNESSLTIFNGHERRRGTIETGETWIRAGSTVVMTKVFIPMQSKGLDWTVNGALSVGRAVDAKGSSLEIRRDTSLVTKGQTTIDSQAARVADASNVVVKDGATWKFHKPIVIGDPLNAPASVRGILTVEKGGTLTAVGAAAADKVIDVENGGILQGYKDAATAKKQIKASNVNVNGGKIKPGNSPGIFAIEADYHQFFDGALEIEIAPSMPGGPVAGDTYDRLAIFGRAAIDGGILDLQLLGYQPNPGERFTILTARDGFDGTPYFRLDGGPSLHHGDQFNVGGVDFRITYPTGGGINGNAGRVVLTAVPAPGSLAILALAAGLAAKRRRNIR